MSPVEGPVQVAITRKLDAAFSPAGLQVLNESHMHNVPEGSESHFRVVVVAEAFDGVPRVARHRAVNKALAEELREGGVHALAIQAHTPGQWAALGREVLPSPKCLGGGKHGMSGHG